MNDCDTCGSTVNSDDNFCAACGDPQNEKAEQRIKQLYDQLPQTKGASRKKLKLPNQIAEYESIVVRVSYTIGALNILASVTLFPSIASVFLLLGGVFFLPPTRLLLGEVIGRSPKFIATVVFSVFLMIIGSVLSILL